jgi:hypothetical protein
MYGIIKAPLMKDKNDLTIQGPRGTIVCDKNNMYFVVKCLFFYVSFICFLLCPFIFYMIILHNMLLCINKIMARHQVFYFLRFVLVSIKLERQ